MVESFILLEPLDSEILLARVDESKVNWVEVLKTAHGGDESVSWLKCGGIVVKDAHWEPSLLALGVYSVCQVVIGIDTSNDVN